MHTASAPQIISSPNFPLKMTDRHIFNDHTTLVLRSLKGLVATHPYLSLIPSLKVVYRADHDPSKVSLICGGGSGHEPGTVGFVGSGLLNASVAGDVFASPSARQVFGAIERVNSDKGVILIITNCEWKRRVFASRRLSLPEHCRHRGQPSFRTGQAHGPLGRKQECRVGRRRGRRLGSKVQGKDGRQALFGGYHPG